MYTAMLPTTEKNMDFIAELQWRGMLHPLTPGIVEHLAEAPRNADIGFDPTAPSQTIGN